jgi:acyl-[acyl carrier protein]--UDP-N-acetylglucosamine O-acyltransferase
MTESTTMLVVSLLGAGDDVRWLAEYVGSLPYTVVAVSERGVEDEIRTALRDNSTLMQAVVTIDQRFMGFLAKRALDTLHEQGIALPTLVHPQACVAADVQLGVGARIAARAVLSTGCSLGAHTRVLEHAVLARDCHVGAFTTLDPGTLLGEATQVGNHCWLRAGLVVEPRTSIGDSVELGPPGVVRGHVPAGTLHIAGLDAPARIHRFG